MIDLHEARHVLRANDRGHFTVPTAPLYPHQWLWDSAWIALGWATSDERRAWTEIESLFLAQWPDGMLPHIVFHKQATTYFPGPEVWQVTTTPPGTGITQPPVVATVVRQIYDEANDRELAERTVRKLLPALLRFHRWQYRARDPDNTGLVAILHPWESGMDNSPAWDEALANVPLPTGDDAGDEADAGLLERKDLEHVQQSERPSTEEYKRYIALVSSFRNSGYAPDRLYRESPFCVVDVGYNALLHRANVDLAALMASLGEDAEEVLHWIHRAEESFEKLWSEEAGVYLSFDRHTERLIPDATAAGLLPMFAGIPSVERARHMAQTLERWGEEVRFLVPTTPASHPRFEPQRYWRGPVWVIVNWLVWNGLRRYGHAQLADRVERDTFELIARNGFREYYNPTTGEGHGGHNFSWSAALTLDWAEKTGHRFQSHR